MNPEEEAGIDKEHETEHLLLHWCAKETLFKMIGQEEVDFLHHLLSVRFPMRKKGVSPSMKPVRKKGRFIGWTTLSPPISY